MPLIKPFSLNVRSQNKRLVNEAVNDLLIEEGDYKNLRNSAQNYDNYDAHNLTARLEKHDLISSSRILSRHK